jgi:hypothetical protein
MTTVRLDRLTIHADATTPPLDARLAAQRAAQLLGASIAAGAAVRPRREAVVDVQLPPGLTAAQLNEFVADAIRRHLV